MSYDAIGFLQTLPKAISRPWEQQIVQFVATTRKERSRWTFREAFDEIASDEKRDCHTRRGALWALGKYYLREQDHLQFESLMKRLRDAFHDDPVYNHLWASWYMDRPGTDNLQAALGFAKRAVTDPLAHAGMFHCYALIVATLIEQKALSSTDGHLNEAMRYVQKAIEQDPEFARFYHTKGILESLDGRYDDARESERQAIQREKHDLEDYSKRLASYYEGLLRINARQSEHEMRQTVANLQEQVAGFRDRYLELLAFFAAVLALITGSFSIMKEQSFTAAFSLLITLGGVLICSFGALAATLRKNPWRNASVVATGLLLITLGYLSSRLL